MRWIALVSFVAFFGCAPVWHFEPQPKSEPDYYVSPEFRNHQIRSITVINIEGRYCAGAELSQDFTERALLRRQYEVVDRRVFDDVLTEQGLQASGLADDQQAIELGRLLSADAVLTGRVVSEKVIPIEIPAHELYIGEVEVELRLVHVETAKILFHCNMKRNSLNYLEHPIEIDFSSNKNDLRKIPRIAHGETKDEIITYVLKQTINEIISLLPLCDSSHN